MQKKILFLAPFPNENNMKDGMISRINSIDKFFNNRERTYLYISLRFNWRKHDENLEYIHIHNLNIIHHFIEICRIVLSADIIYVHSIYMIKHIWYMLFFLKSIRIILDAHGAVPEEERYFKNRKLILFYFWLIERIAFRKVDAVICVTDSMKKHFQQKFPTYKGNYYVFSNMPLNLKNSSVKNLISDDEKIYVLYSGGISPWQKVDYMLEIIEKNQAPNIFYIILSGHIGEFREKVAKYNIDSDNLIMESVLPSELETYYNLADYGFVLRDDNPVNRVANPTKMVEYLYYGIIPVVLTPYIGDYAERGMEYLSVNDFNIHIKKPLERSQKNISIILDLIKENNSVNISDIVIP
jgi:glycosyltransferase involved in cell wall biosynthesis